MPQHCLLCAAGISGRAPARGPHAAVCAGCEADLPRIPCARCAVCAAPLPTGSVCGACLKRPPRFASIAAAFVYGHPIDALVQALKYGGNLALAGPLADWMAEVPAGRADLIVPMPLSAQRLRSRGFNQAHEIARRLARRTGIALAGDACRRVRDTAPQAMLPWSARPGNVRGAFVCDASLTGLHVAVVDDVVTTGATLNELARALRRAGAARVSGWVVARAVRRAWPPALTR